MPFDSKAQRRWMYANMPEKAKEWEEETPKDKDLPEKKEKKDSNSKKKKDSNPKKEKKSACATFVQSRTKSAAPTRAQDMVNPTPGQAALSSPDTPNQVPSSSTGPAGRGTNTLSTLGTPASPMPGAEALQSMASAPNSTTTSKPGEGVGEGAITGSPVKVSSAKAAMIKQIAKAAAR